ncbi:MAG: hypothetical protein KAS23_00450 [Anaerohalosphaera sp.]|nr:hypothetical protein [Anaerohalosphaera sp.]
MVLLGVIVNVLAWRYWGRRDLARRYCGMLCMGTFDAWNKEKVSKFRQAMLAEKAEKNPNLTRVSSGAEELFVCRISGAEQGSLQQYVWGTLYRALGVMASRTSRDWIISFMVILLMTCFLCYMEISGLIFVMLGIMFARVNLGVYSSLLICGGRRERFWSALAAAVATGVFVAVIVLVLAMVTRLLEMVMPQVTIRGSEYAFSALNMKYCSVPFVMIPITLTLNLINYKRSMLPVVVVIFIFQFLFVFCVAGELIVMDTSVRIGPWYVVIILLCSWVIFIGVLRRICRRQSLVGQGK